jgi:hypothetical protein
MKKIILFVLCGAIIGAGFCFVLTKKVIEAPLVSKINTQADKINEQDIKINAQTTIINDQNLNISQIGEQATQLKWGIPIVYTNAQYGFKFVLPETWKGYSVVNSAWGSGMNNVKYGDGKIGTTGPAITFRNPNWTKDKPYQDIPIEIFTIEQWNGLDTKYEAPWAGGIPMELGRNSKYVFELNSRYNAAEGVAGMNEVNKIIESEPLHAF